MKTTYLLLLGSLCSIAALCQTTVTCPALIDNTLRADFPTNSSGVSPNLFVGMTDNGARRRALVKFDLSQVPVGATINSVTLTMRVNRTQTSTNIPVSLHKANSQWGQGNSGAGPDGGGQGESAQANDATWTMRLYPATAWATSGGDFTAAASATSNVGAQNTSPTWTSTQMATDVQNWVANPASNFGWLIKSNETGSKNVKRFSSLEGGTVAQRPTLSVTYTSGTLPVTLINVNAAETDKGVKISWQTQSEFNNAYFIVEHSRDGINFSSIGKVTGAGTTNTPRAYDFLHQAVASGKHYYRLAQTDINNQVRYSAIVPVSVKIKQKQLTITPNPVRDFINLRGISINDNMKYSISNASGSVVSAGKLTFNKIDASPLAAGFYVLVISTGTERFSGHFVKE